MLQQLTKIPQQLKIPYNYAINEYFRKEKPAKTQAFKMN